MTKWKPIEGYRFEYRISEEGEVQRKLKSGWKTLVPLLYKGGGGRASTVLSVKLAVWPDGFKRIAVVRLMEGRFIRARGPGEVVIHRNGFSGDCGANNLMIVKRSEIPRSMKMARKPVKKVDKYGVVLGFYGSITEAAKKNFFSVSCVKRHLYGMVKDRFRNGYTFVYDC